MSAIATQITGISIVCSTVCSSADQRKHESSASLALVRGIHRPPHKRPVTRKMFPLDDVITISTMCDTMHSKPIATYAGMIQSRPVITRSFFHQNIVHTLSFVKSARGCFNIKTLSYQYKDSNYTDKTVTSPAYFLLGESLIWKDVFCIESDHVSDQISPLSPRCCKQ